MSSWSLDLPFNERERRVRAKATKLGISAGEAYKLCVVEYETGVPLNKITQQTKNAYNVYVTKGTRPGTEKEKEHMKNVKAELVLADAYALQRAINLKLKADKSVDEREIEQYGYEHAEKSKRSVKEFDEEQGYFGIGEIRLPSLKLPGADIAKDVKTSMQVTGLVIMAFVALIIYLIFVSGKGGEGVTIGSVG